MLNIISAMDIDVSNATRAIVLDDTGTEFGILFDEVSEPGWRLIASTCFCFYFRYFLYNGLTQRGMWNILYKNRCSIIDG